MAIKLIARSIAQKSFNFALVAHICISGPTFLHRPINIFQCHGNTRKAIEDASIKNIGQNPFLFLNCKPRCLISDHQTPRTCVLENKAREVDFPDWDPPFDVPPPTTDIEKEMVVHDFVCRSHLYHLRFGNVTSRYFIVNLLPSLI